MSAPPPQPGISAASTEVLAKTIAAAVERQLTQQAETLSKQFEARLGEQQQAADAYQKALQTALEERLADFAKHQQLSLNEINNRIIESAGSGGSHHADGGGGIDSGELVTLREQIDSSSAAAHARIDELAKSARRFDEQASALVQHVNDTSQALTLRMDDGNQALASAVEERFGFVRATLEAFGPEIQRQITDQATALSQRVDFTENKITDRMLAMEDRVVEQNGTKIAGLEATIGRIGSGFDEAIAALSQRMLELENSLSQVILHTNVLTEQISQVDSKAIEGIREQLSAAVGEAMLVRIEIDRVAATTDERLDRSALRMAEIESLLGDEMDVNASVQLERLDELERAISALDPDQFVRKVDPGAGGAATTDRSLSSL
ncbi:MAG: hypothetical protein K8R99_06070 [Actinomycetia bacterium]|nr:hypothetical protein [Actinomycetes bacterium]